MDILSIKDSVFREYGQVIEGIDTPELQAALAKTPRPDSGVDYIASVPELEAVSVFAQIRDNIFGGMPIQIGYCNGNNDTLNALEYHRDSELNLPINDVVVLLAHRWDIKDGKLDSADVKAFHVPAGTMIELYATTLHYAPCAVSAKDGFRGIVVLPRGTNGEKPEIEELTCEDKMLWGRDKWVIAHPDSGDAAQGIYAGITGENLRVPQK